MKGFKHVRTSFSQVFFIIGYSQESSSELVPFLLDLTASLLSNVACIFWVTAKFLPASTDYFKFVDILILVANILFLLINILSLKVTLKKYKNGFEKNKNQISDILLKELEDNFYELVGYKTNNCKNN